MSACSRFQTERPFLHQPQISLLQVLCSARDKPSPAFCLTDQTPMGSQWVLLLLLGLHVPGSFQLPWDLGSRLRSVPLTISSEGPVKPATHLAGTEKHGVPAHVALSMKATEDNQLDQISRTHTGYDRSPISCPGPHFPFHGLSGQTQGRA